jgi:hypothetical protein
MGVMVLKDQIASNEVGNIFSRIDVHTCSLQKQDKSALKKTEPHVVYSDLSSYHNAF